MNGETLGDIRTHIEALAAESGEYYLVCSRYGDRPVPAADLSFEDRETAQKAARATERYRATLRQYDTRLPRYDIIVCQAGESHQPETLYPAPPRAPIDDWTLSERVVGRSTTAGNSQSSQQVPPSESSAAHSDPNSDRSSQSKNHQ
jgi:hypothetical protein